MAECELSSLHVRSCVQLPCGSGESRKPWDFAEEDWAKDVDYPSRRRQMLTLQEIQSLARNLADMSRTPPDSAAKPC